VFFRHIRGFVTKKTGEGYYPSPKETDASGEHLRVAPYSKPTRSYFNLPYQESFSIFSRGLGSLLPTRKGRRRRKLGESARI